MRWAAGIEYAGTAYRGWQKLSHIDSVQARVEDALGRVANHPLRVMASGRTDGGVHAAMQVIHFDSPAERDERAWCMGANSHLPGDIAVRWARLVDDGFHARHAATWRAYRYVFLCAGARSALWRDRCAWSPHELDAERMHEAAQVLVGEHDFSAFRAAECQSPTPMRRLDAIAVHRRGSFVCIDVGGNAFLHHMVRNIAGSLSAVGRGAAEPAWIGTLLAGRDRRAAAATAPAAGLYLLGARYPEAYDIPSPVDPVFP
ncbi:tRNA pseudouridine(38-40) synthase TruA [Algiphilus sp.]|uniref:tRNA pseudouridine(38-40) synthase TruA n=1 Tax=Algiphilus sp. TaxID=1872431 RepID=UPI0025BC2756|nr:tRNA pseudouridine(38-40) synthase TruA [Algiphilus sp.]